MCEAETGSRYIHGFPDPENGGLSGPPVRPDMGSVAGLQAASGIVSFLAIRVVLNFVVFNACVCRLALLARREKRKQGQNEGMMEDVSILER